MIDLTLSSSDDENPPQKRARGSPPADGPPAGGAAPARHQPPAGAPAAQRQVPQPPSNRHNSAQDPEPAAAPRYASSFGDDDDHDPELEELLRMPFRTAAAGQAAAAAIGRGPTHLRGSAGGSRNNSGTGGTGAAGAAGSGSEDGEEAGGEAAGRKGGRGRGRGRGGGGSRGGSRGAGGSGSGGSSPEYRVSGEDEEVLAADLQEEEEGMSGGEGGGRGAAARRKQAGGRGKRLTSEERAEREAAKEADKLRRAEERQRAKEDKEAAKEADKERKKQEKLGRAAAKQAEKEEAKAAKEANNSLKCTMVGRHLRLLLSNGLAAAPLGLNMRELAPRLRTATRDAFPVEVHRGMPLAAKGYRYCMWGVRLPHAAAARLTGGEEGCALEPCNLPDPEAQGGGLPLLLFPLLVVVLDGDELLGRLEAAPATPLAALHADLARAHPEASPLVYVVGLEAAMRRRERANKAFDRGAIEDALMDVTVGMPAIRLQYDCPESDLSRAATDILNLGWALAQHPRRRADCYLQHFGSRQTLPLRAVLDRLEAGGCGREQRVLCDALSELVAPQRAAAVAAEYGSLGAIMEALRARPESERDSLLARCRIPGAVPGPRVQLHAGPAAAAALARFLAKQNGRDGWEVGADPDA